MRRRRGLHPEEVDLWTAVARSIRPMHDAPLLPEQHRLMDPPPPEPRVNHHEPASHRPLTFHVGEKAKVRQAHEVLPPLPEQLAQAPLRMDRKTHEKMTRGKISPEARIDLHGMTVSEAHPELIRFILNSQSDGLRLVLVITGKGKPGPDYGPIPIRYGVLKHQVPHWLRLPPLGPAVLQVTEAHLRHGGTGAYYVYLRRR